VGVFCGIGVLGGGTAVSGTGVSSEMGVLCGMGVLTEMGVFSGGFVDGTSVAVGISGMWVGVELGTRVAGCRVEVGVHSPSPTKFRLKMGRQSLSKPLLSHPVTRKTSPDTVALNVPSPCHSTPNSLKNSLKLSVGVSVGIGVSVDVAVSVFVAEGVIVGEALAVSVGNGVDVALGTKVSVGPNVLVGTAVGRTPLCVKKLQALATKRPPVPNPSNFNARLLSISIIKTKRPAKRGRMGTS